MPRQRFFSSGGSSQELPLTASAVPSPPSSDNGLRLAPGRSQSSSAALLRQRVSPTSPQKPSWKGDLDGFDYAPYGSYQAQNDTTSSACFGWMKTLCIAVAFLGLTMLGLHVHETNLTLKHTLRLRDHEIDHHIDHVHELEIKVQKLRSETIYLNGQIERLEQEDPSDVANLEIQRRLFHLEHSHNIIEQGIQSSARRLLKEK